MLLSVAPKKPRWQALINQLDQLSLESIRALPEPLWVREALEILKDSSGVGQRQRLQEIVQDWEKREAAARSAPQPTYEVRLWDGGPEFVGSEAHNGHHSWKIQIDTNDTFLVVDDHWIRFSDSTLLVDHASLTTLMAGSRLVGYMTLNHYKGFKQALLNQRHPII